MARSTWTIDPARSRVSFTVRHMVVSKVRGRFTRFAGAVELDEEELARSTVEARIEVASVETGDRERDEYLRTNEFLDPARHPELIFRSRRVEAAGRGKWRLVGELSIRGVTREVALAVEESARGAGRRGFRASGTISRKDWNLEWGSLVEAGGFVVGDKLGVAIEVELIAGAA
jgi:polyisoprenoid-binding protein YceI